MSCASNVTPPTLVKYLTLPESPVRTKLSYEDADDSVFHSTTTESLPPPLPSVGVVLPNGRVSPSNVPQSSQNGINHRGTQTAGRKASGSNVPLRKLSTSGLLQDPSLSVYAAAAEKARESHDSTMRKISQVGHVLTSTFGLSRQPSHDDIVAQSRTLCGRYIRYKVRGLSGLSCKKLNLQRLRSVTNLSAIFGPTSQVAKQNPCLKAVSCHIRRLGLELERSHPKLFHSVTSNVGIHSLSSEVSAQHLQQSVARELFPSDFRPNWGRIVALFAVSGALAMDCVRLGKPEYVMGLVDGLAHVVDRSLADWIADQGGWEALHGQFRKCKRNQLLTLFLHLVLPIAVLVTVVGIFDYTF